MKALDLCAGAGGLTLGLGAAGFDVLGVENNPLAHATHVQNVGPCDLADVSTYWPKPGFSLVAGGVPCQPYSEAGDREGLTCARGLLYRDLIRIAILTGAQGIVLENVKGLLVWNDGWALDTILFDLQLAGFDPEWRLIDLSEFGVPQNRHRVIIVAFRDGLGPFQWPEPWSRKVSVRETLGLTGPYHLGRLPGATSGAQGQRYIDVDNQAFTVRAHDCQDLLYPVGGQPRRPSVLETAALQTFPTMAWIGPKKEQYRQVGNAVPPLFAYQLGLKLIQRWTVPSLTPRSWT